MEVLSDAEADWWRVLHLTTRCEGLIPVNFVAEESSVESEELVKTLFEVFSHYCFFLIIFVFSVGFSLTYHVKKLISFY